MMNNLDKVTVNFPLSKQAKEEINQIAKAMGLKKQFLLEQLVREGLVIYKSKHRL